MNNRTKATNIPADVKRRVYERDNGRCVWCGRCGMPEAHFISRVDGGLGIEENILTLCRFPCHELYDKGPAEKRDNMRRYFRKYLMSKYPDWDEKKLIYKSPWGVQGR